MHQIRSVSWIPETPGGLRPGKVRILDQTKLPAEVSYLETADPDEIWDAIKNLRVRGAPAIGITAAMGLAAAIQNSQATSTTQLIEELDKASQYLAGSRPTAVNLFWALERMKNTALASSGTSVPELKDILVSEAVRIRDEDARMCRSIGSHGVSLLPNPCSVLTHCNAGGLATSEFGTALAPIYTAKEQGREIKVFADETRPLLQGARLTTWELLQEGIDVTLICDSAAGHVMNEGRVDAVLVGADRIAANGDVANKIGTYSLAVLADRHSIPFYVLAPGSTIDMKTSDGKRIPIEERDSAEITRSFGMHLAPDGVKTYAPAFDVTPADLVTAIISEKGIARPDYRESLAQIAQA
jgi:methylthioribose-1-phosphate isomerase